MAKIKTIEAECGKLPDGKKASLTATAQTPETDARKSFACYGKALDVDGRVLCERRGTGECPVYHDLLRQIGIDATDARSNYVRTPEYLASL